MLMIERLMTQPCTITRAVPTDEKDANNRPVVELVSVETRGYCQLETQFADPAIGLDGNEVRIFLLPTVDLTYVQSIEIGEWTYEPRGSQHHQFNPRTNTYTYVMIRGRRAD